MDRRKRQVRQRGSVMIEGALSLVLTFLLILGIMECGRLFQAYNSVCYGARLGARFAAVHGQASGQPASSADVLALVRKHALIPNPSLLEVVTSWQPDSQPGSRVRVRVKYQFQPMVSLTGLGNVPLISSSTMVIAQ